MWLTGPRGGFRTHHEFTAGERQQVPFLCGVENIAGHDRQLLAGLQILEADRRDVVALHVRADWPMSHQATEQTLSSSRTQQVFKHLTVRLPAAAGIWP
jgi:hypothetical protein